jgi:sugar phosphate isomerase/epimerase
MSTPNQPIASPTTQQYLTSFRTELVAALSNQETDRQVALTEAAHSSGLYAHVQQLEQEVVEYKKRIDEATAKLGADTTPPTGANAERDPRTHLTAFQAAAPVLESQSKARTRRALAIAGLEVGLIALAIWAAVVLTRDPIARIIGETRAAAVTDLTFPRLALWVGVVLMILSGLSGVVYLS